MGELKKEQVKFGRDPYLTEDDRRAFSLLYGKISRFALEKLRNELIFSNQAKFRKCKTETHARVMCD